MYIDEAGCTGDLASATSEIQPVFCITGLIVPQRDLYNLTQQFLDLKRKFFPKIVRECNHDLEIMLHEIKGAGLRKKIRDGNRDQRRHVLRLIGELFDLLEKHNCELIARAYVKKPMALFDGRAVYTSAMQTLCHDFQVYLASKTAKGLIIADSRNKEQNNNLSFSIFTKKYRRYAGDAYPSLFEMPTFGHSENHAGLQISDLLASAVLFPSVTYVYCTGHVNNVHVHPRYQLIKRHFSYRLKKMQYRYDDGGRHRGGITVVDNILKSRSAHYLFQQ